MEDQLILSTVFIAGILSFFSPCIVPILPVYVSTLSVDVSGKAGKTVKFAGLTLHPTLIMKTLVFVLGISTSFVLLGFGAGSLGSLIQWPWFLKLCGLLVIALGIHQTGLVHFSFLDREKKLNLEASQKDNILGTYVLGLTFSFGWTPCIGPVLGAVLGLSAAGGQAWYSAWLMMVYALGMMIPFMTLAIFSDVLLRRIKGINKYLPQIKIAGGVMIILMGILLLTDSLTLLTYWFDRLFN